MYSWENDLYRHLGYICITNSPNIVNITTWYKREKLYFEKPNSPAAKLKKLLRLVFENRIYDSAQYVIVRCWRRERVMRSVEHWGIRWREVNASQGSAGRKLTRRKYWAEVCGKGRLMTSWEHSYRRKESHDRDQRGDEKEILANGLPREDGWRKVI